LARSFFAVLCFLVIALAPTGSVLASEDLFRVAVPVASQSAAERAKAARVGLRKVLLRMAGSPSAVDAEGLSKAYSQAQNYLEQFHYEPYSRSKSSLSFGEEAPKDATELLVMTFSQQVIAQLLREAGQPYWPPNRPRVFVWLVEDTDTGKVLVNNRESPIVQGLLQGARDRGLPIQLPLLDLEDQLALPPEKLWELDKRAILEASERYNADTLLVGRYSQTSRGQWLATWQFLHRTAAREYDLRADTGVELGWRAIRPLADYLANLYAVTPQDQESPYLVMQLSDIESFGSYRLALDYLQELAVVSDVKVQAVRADTLLLHLQIDGDVNTLRNVLALDRKLQPANTPAPDDNTPPWLRVKEGTPEKPVAYLWVGR
jgi:hypothetical protein